MEGEMDYTSLRRMPTEERQRIVSGLKRLRTGLRANVPRKGPGSLLLATWNIREFGGSKYGERMKDACFFIAECLNHFDLIAVQEVRRDLKPLYDVMDLLGRQWDVIYTDVAYTKGGNSERLAFLFDKNQAFFTGLAGELVLPPNKSKIFAQVARTPFICGFQAGWAKFNLCTVHIYYGTGHENAQRVGEINETARLLAAKAQDYINVERRLAYSPENLLLLGDFNIAKHSHKTFEALTKNDFVVPPELQKLPGSNVAKDKFYDQIAFYQQTEGIRDINAGIFDFFEFVYNDESVYKKFANATKARDFKEWRTYQMSDHLIMWTQFNVDKTDVYLEDVLTGSGQRPTTRAAVARGAAEVRRILTPRDRSTPRRKGVKTAAKKRAKKKRAKTAARKKTR
jgi:hypothetical protein